MNDGSNIGGFLTSAAWLGAADTSIFCGAQIVNLLPTYLPTYLPIGIVMANSLVGKK